MGVEKAASGWSHLPHQQRRRARVAWPGIGPQGWLFAGSDRGGERAAFLYSLIVTAKLNDIDPQAWLADVLARIADHPAGRLDELLPWNWTPCRAVAEAA